MNIVIRIFHEFFELLIDVLPYFIIGALIGALLKTVLTEKIVLKYLKKGTSSVVLTGIFGGLVPVCSCSMVPMANGIRKSGAGLGATISFLMVAPILSPVVILLNYSFFGLKLTIARIAIALLGGIGVGILVNFLTEKGWFKITTNNTAGQSGCCETEAASKSKFSEYVVNLKEILKDLLKYFLAGLFIAAVLGVLLPPEVFQKYVRGPFAYILAALIGIPIYVCSGEEIPIAYSFTKLGLEIGPAFAFMLAASGVCIPTIMMVQKFLGKKLTAFYVGIWFIFAIISGIAVSKI